MLSPALIEKVEKIQTPYRLLILVGSVGLLALVFFFMIWSPMDEKENRLETSIQRLEKDITKAKSRAKNKAKFEAELAMVDSQFKEALKLLPNEREIPRLLKSITQQGSDSNLEFRLFSPKPEQSRDFYVEIPVSVEVRGEYHDVARFFDKVGNMQRIVNILDVSMKPEKDFDSSLLTQCVAVTYRFKERKPDEEKRSKRKKKRRTKRKSS